MAMFSKAIGSFGIGSGSFDGPVDVVGDREGNLYVLDAGNNRVQMFDASGEFVLAWGSFGSRHDNFRNPSALAVTPVPGESDSDFIYVVDGGNNRIMKFKILHDPPPTYRCPDVIKVTDPKGEDSSLAHAGGEKVCFISAWGRLGSRDGFFNNPVDIAFDDKNQGYVLDAGNQRVQKFRFAPSSADCQSLDVNTFEEKIRGHNDQDICHLGEISRFGSRGGTFTELVSITWSDEQFGYLYLLGKPGCTVQQLEMNGSFLRSWSAAAPESGLCEPSRVRWRFKEDILYVLDSGNGRLLRFAQDGRYLSELRGAERPFEKPRGFNINQELDEIAVADTGSNLVQKFTLR